MKRSGHSEHERRRGSPEARTAASASLWLVSDGDAGSRLDKYLASPDRLKSRGRAADALDRGRIFVNDIEATSADASRALTAGDAVRLWADRPGSAQRRGALRTGALDIVFEDSSLVAINKPPGLLAVPLAARRDAPSVHAVLDAQLRRQGKRRSHVVHRIDRDTSGLVVFAKTTRAQRALKEQFRRREPERVYWAVVYGQPSPPAGTWRDHLVWDPNALIQKETHPKDPRAAEAVSEYRVLERFRGTSLIEVRLHTGKRNQIRLQARLRGHTLVGETRYVYGPEELRPIAFQRQALHARRLRFVHPKTGRTVELVAPLPEDLSRLIERLRSS